MKTKPGIKPIGDKILVKRLEAESKTAGGIVLPDSAQEKPKKGKVVGLGAGRQLKDGSRADFQVKKDDIVLFTSYGGTEIKIDGEEYLILEETEILAVTD